MTRGSKAGATVGRTSLRSAGITLRSRTTHQNSKADKKKSLEVKKSASKTKQISKDEGRKIVGRKSKITKGEKSKQSIEEKSNEEENKSSTDSTSQGENIRRSSRQATKERKVWSKRKLSAVTTDDDSDFEDIPDDKQPKRKLSAKERDAKVSLLKRKANSIDNGLNRVNKRLKTVKTDEEKTVKRGRGRPRKVVSESVESDREHETTIEEDTKSVDLNEVHPAVEDNSQIFTLKSAKEASPMAFDSQVRGDHLGKNNVSITSQIIRESLLAPPSHLAKSIMDLKNTDEPSKTISNALSSKARLIFNRPSDSLKGSAYQHSRNRFVSKSRLASKPVRSKGKNWKEILSTNYTNKLKSISDMKKMTDEAPHMNGSESLMRVRKGTDIKRVKGFISEDDRNDDAASSILRKFRLSQLRTETRVRDLKNQSKAIQDNEPPKAAVTSDVPLQSVSTHSPVCEAPKVSTTSDEEKESVRKTVELFEGPVDHIPELPISATINKLKERISSSLSDVLYGFTEKDEKQKTSMQKQTQLPSDKLLNSVKSDDSTYLPSNIERISSNTEPSNDFLQPPLNTSPFSPEAVEEGKVSLKAALAELLMESEQESNMADQNKQTLTIHSAPKNTEVLPSNILASSIIDGNSKGSIPSMSVVKRPKSSHGQDVKGTKEKVFSGLKSPIQSNCLPIQTLPEDLHDSKDEDNLDYSGTEVDEENDVTIVSSASKVLPVGLPPPSVDHVKSPPPHTPMKIMPSLIKMPFRPLTIKTPLKCPICPMQFCTVRSLLWHFGQHESSGGPHDQRKAPCPLLEDLKAPWIPFKNDENSKPLQLFKKLTQIITPNVFSGPPPGVSESSLVKGPGKVTPSPTKRKPIPNLHAPKANQSSKQKGADRKADSAGQSNTKPPKRNSIIPEKSSSSKSTRITGSNLRNSPFVSKSERDYSAPQHIISHNTPLAATSTGVVATVLGNHTISEVTDKVKSLKSKKSSSKKKSDVILKIPIPRLNKAPTSPTSLPSSPHNKTKFVNILPKMCGYSSPTYNSNQPMNLSTKDNALSIAQNLNHSAPADRSPPPLVSSKLRHPSLTITPVTNPSMSSRVASTCVSSPLSHLTEDNLVMINPNLGLRIVSTIGSTSSCIKRSPSDPVQVEASSNTTTTSAINIKPIMSPVAPNSSNILTILPTSGKDSLTIVAQNSKEAFKRKRTDSEDKTPDILTIVPQVDGKMSAVSSRNNIHPPAQIMTAVGQLSPSQAMNLVLLNKTDKSIAGSKSLSPRRSTSVGMKSPNARLTIPNVSSPNMSSRTSFRNRSFTSDVEELDSEDDRMFIDDQSFADEEPVNDPPMDPLAMCSVTLDEENKEAKALKSQKSIANCKAMSSPKVGVKPNPMSPPPRLHALSSLPNLTPLNSSSFTRAFRPIAPLNKPPITLVPINSPAMIPHGIASLATQTAVAFNSHPLGPASSASMSSVTLALYPTNPSPLCSSPNSTMRSLSQPIFTRRNSVTSPSAMSTGASKSLLGTNIPSSVMVPHIGNVTISTNLPVPQLNKFGSMPLPSSSDSIQEEGEPIYKRTVEMDTGKYNKRKYVCKFCGRRFGWSTDLKRHVILHTGEKPFKCPSCGTAFTRKFLMQNHMKRMHGEEVEVEHS